MPPTLEKQLYVYHIQPRLSIPHLPRQRYITFPDRRLGSRPVDGRGRGEALFPAPVPATGTFFRYGIVFICIL